MSRSLGEGVAVTKLPQTKIRRSRPPVEASSRMVRNRPESHRRLGDEPPKRDMNSCQPAACTPGGSSPSLVNSGSTTKRYQMDHQRFAKGGKASSVQPTSDDARAFVGTDSAKLPRRGLTRSDRRTTLKKVTLLRVADNTPGAALYRFLRIPENHGESCPDNNSTASEPNLVICLLLSNYTCLSPRDRL